MAGWPASYSVGNSTSWQLQQRLQCKRASLEVVFEVVGDGANRASSESSLEAKSFANRSKLVWRLEVNMNDI